MSSSRSFRALVVLNLFIISTAAVVFLWVIPILPYWLPMPFAAIFYIWYQKEKHGNRRR